MGDVNRDRRETHRDAPRQNDYRGPIAIHAGRDVSREGQLVVFADAVIKELTSAINPWRDHRPRDARAPSTS